MVHHNQVQTSLKMIRSHIRAAIFQTRTTRTKTVLLDYSQAWNGGGRAECHDSHAVSNAALRSNRTSSVTCSSGYRCVLLTMLFPYYDVFYRPIEGLDTINDDSCKLEFD